MAAPRTASDLAVAFSKAIEHKFNEAEKLKANAGEKYTYEYSVTAIPGRRYDRITIASRFASEPEAPFESRRAYAFVERSTGDLFKAAGWSAPAKGVRFDGEIILSSAVDLADPYGSFLYV